MNGERRCWGRVEFLKDCRSGNGRYRNGFLPTSVVGRENQKDPFLMRRKRKECCQQEGKSALVMLNSSVSKILHEFHLESGKKDRNKEKLRVICVSYRVFNCILVHFIPLPVFIFYSFFFFILFYLLFFHVHCTGLFFLFFFFISILFLSTRFPCSLYQRGWDCTGVGGTIPRGQSLCESMSLCRCLIFILCMPVCNYTLRLTLCAVYG